MEPGARARRLLISMLVMTAVGCTTLTAAGAGFSISEGKDVLIAARGEKIVFELAGRIWSLPPGDPVAIPLTDRAAYSRNPSISADGSKIAFESIRDGFRQIMVMDADGSALRQVTFGDYHHRTPSWSPTAPSRLVMSSDRGGDYGLWELDVESLGLRQLSFLNGDETEPSWAPDGQKLVFVTTADAGSAIQVLDLDGQVSNLLREDSRIRAPAWRPGGGTVTYVRQDENGSQLRMLILSDPAITKPITKSELVHAGPVQWLDREKFIYAADGKIRRREFGLPSANDIPFSAVVEVGAEQFARRSLDFDHTDNRPVRGIAGASPTPHGTLVVSALGDLWEFDIDRNDKYKLLRQLTNDAFVDTHPAVSPDGKRLAYVSDRNGTLQLWTLTFDGLRQQRLTSETGMAIYPAWNKNSDAIAYLSTEHPASVSLTMKVIDIDPGRTRVLSENVVDAAPPRWDETAETFVVRETAGSAGTWRTTAALPGPVPLTWNSGEPDGRLIVRAGRIFDGIGPGYLTEHEIEIRGSRIAAIRPWSDDDNADRVIDVRDKTVIPGFIDLSVRQSFVTSERIGRTWLAYGVTTIRESVGDFGEALERQESWSSGRRIGPRMIPALRACRADFEEPWIDGLPAGAALENVALIELCTALAGDSLEQAIATAHENSLPVATNAPFPGMLLGADEIRLVHDVGDEGPTVTSYDVATLAGTSGKTVLSRLSPLGLAGLSGREELTGQSKFRMLFTAADRKWYENQWNQLVEADQPAATASSRILGQTLFRAVATGARVAVGTDSPRTPSGLALHAELQLLTDIGLQPFQVLKMASLDAARLVGAGEQLGSIHVGKLADLVVIDGDPLDKIGDTSKTVITIVDGRVYPVEALMQPGRRTKTVGKLYN